MPAQDKYYHSGKLSEVLKTMPREKYIDMHNIIDYYVAQYKIGKKQVGNISIASSFHDVLDEEQKAAQKNDTSIISCKKGCGFCCYLHVDISDDEAELLLWHIEQKGIKIDWEHVKKQANHNLDGWDDLKYAERRCAFLGNDNICRVYEHRPSSCRNLYVVSPASQCDNLSNPHGGVTYNVNTIVEIIGSAQFNATKSGTMADMLLEAKSKQ